MMLVKKIVTTVTLMVVGGVLLSIAGAASVWQGLDIVQLERGWTMVISGAVAFTGGVVTLAIGLLTREVRLVRLAIGPAKPQKRKASQAAESEPAAPVQAADQQAFVDAAIPARARARPEEPDAASQRPRPRALRRFEAHGATYTLFADGSIEADSPEGQRTFSDMDALRAHLAKLEAQAARVSG
jgi:hypothetical protein